MSETSLCDARMRDNDGAWCCIRVKHEGREHQWAPDTSFLAEMAGRMREVNEQFGDAVVLSPTQETDRNTLDDLVVGESMVEDAQAALAEIKDATRPHPGD